MQTRIVTVDPRSLKLLEVNARYMKHETFQALVANIKKDGALTSVPFACRDGDGWLVLSGNHRVKAAIAAELAEIEVMVTDEELPLQRRIAIQLSHNALAGEDDPALLKQLYEQMGEVEWRVYSGLDDKTLDLLKKVKPASLSEANLEFQPMTFIFLPSEIERAKTAFEQAKGLTKGLTWLARWDEYDRLLDALEQAGDAHGVKNVATALALILDVFEAHLDDLAAGWEPQAESKSHWVPIASVVNTSNVPAPVAKVLKQAVDKMLREGAITTKARWQALEYLAADYLAGPDGSLG